MSLQELATAAGISKNHVWDLERGCATNPTVKTLHDLGMAMDFPPSALAIWAFRAFKRADERPSGRASK
jgi:transcriptional regulator with XRE-family HTH domain